jgi:hypothetical protein
MTLNAKVQVELPSKGIIVCRSGGYPAVYKVLRTYRNEKGQPTNDRVNIGKLDRETGLLIPNPKYYDHYDSHNELTVFPEYTTIRRVGGTFLLGEIMKSLGIVEALDEALGEKRSRLAQTAAIYMVAKGNVFERVLEYCEEFTLTEKALASPSSSELFRSITYDERMAFFKNWLKRQPPGEYLAYDVTSFSTYAKNIMDSEYGYNRDGERLPQINLGCFLSESTGLPVFYVTYSGSIVDKSHLPYMMEYNSELGIENTAFVLDKGFCSTNNIKYMAQKGYQYILSVENRTKTIQSAIDIARNNIKSTINLIAKGVYCIAIKGSFFGTPGVLHVCYSPELEIDHKDVLFRKIDMEEEELARLRPKRVSESEIKQFRKHFSITLEDGYKLLYKRDTDKIDAIVMNYGFFCLLTNTKLDSTQVLSIYRRRDMIEKGFDDVKNYLDMKRMRTHTTKTTDGKLCCCFISLIIASEIGIKLKDFLKKRSWSKDIAIGEMEKIVVCGSGNNLKLLNPLTKTQRLILEPFGLGEEELRAYLKAAS